MTVRWWVVFDDSSTKDDWWNIFTRAGMRHCWCYAEFQDGWISIDNGGVVTGMYYTSRAQIEEMGFKCMADYCLRKGKMVLPCVREIATVPGAHMAFPMTCVSLVKSFFGLRCWAVTPWQLYKYLAKHHLDVVEWQKVNALMGAL